MESALTQANSNVAAKFAELRAELAENGYTDRAKRLLTQLETAHTRRAQLSQGVFETPPR